MKPMKVRYGNQKFEFEFECNDQKEFMKQMHQIAEVAEHNVCENCKSTNVMMRVRNVDDNDFYEIFCKDCCCALAFGQHKKGGTLFPKRDKGILGWHKWVPGQDDNNDDSENKPKNKVKK